MRVDRADGASLIEVLIAPAVFVGGVASLLQLFTLAIAANLGARSRTEAAIVASDTVEELLAAAWGTEVSAADDRNGFRREWRVAPLAANPDAALIIDVRVSHTRADTVRLVAVKVRQVQ